MSDSNLIPAEDITNLPSRGVLQARADANAMRIAQENPWMANLDQEFETILSTPGSLKAIYLRFRKLADRIAAAVQPHSACKKHCSQCCHISVAISGVEADIITQVTGIKHQKGPVRMPEEGMADRYFRQPCPFLKGNACSVYQDRPMACRLHFAISDTHLMCDTRIFPADSAVPNINLNAFYFAYMSAMHVSPMEDIRYYFPSSKAK